MKVRHATEADHLAMIELAKEFFEANDFTHLEIDIDMECVAALIIRLTKSHLMLILETDDNEIVGGVGGTVGFSLFDAKIRLFQEMFFYVKVGFRNRSQLLLANLIKACKQLKLDRMIMGYPSSNGKVNKMERFYNARGYKKLETHFIKRI